MLNLNYIFTYDCTFTKLKYNLTSDLHTGRRNNMKCLQDKTNILKYLPGTCVSHRNIIKAPK